MQPFLQKMEACMDHMQRKSCFNLLQGQHLELGDAGGNSTRFRYAVRKMSPVGNIQATLAPIDSSSHQLFYEVPETVRQYLQEASPSSISVLFGASSRPPALSGVNPISPIVTLNFADSDGHIIQINDLTEPVNITIPISIDGLCDRERQLWSGKGRCLYYDAHYQSYVENGCKTVQTNDASVTCMCLHLTSFIIEVSCLSKCASSPYQVHLACMPSLFEISTDHIPYLSACFGAVRSGNLPSTCPG